MKKTLPYKIMLVVAVLATVLIVSCSKVPTLRDMGPRHRIVVVHSWDSIGEEKELFSKTMEKAFKERNLNVDIHHIYARMVRRPIDVFEVYDAKWTIEEIKRYKPEIILLNDDPIVEWLLTRENPDSIFLNTPIVFAGVNTLLRDSLYRFPQMTGFEDRIDLGRNIEELMRLGGSQNVVVELDYGDVDERLRAQFNDELSDSTRFVNNSNFFLRDLTEKNLQQHFPGLVVVNFVSCAQPYMNRSPGEEDVAGKNLTGLFYQNAATMWHMQVKYDIFSNSLINHTGKPQFTCIREQFGNPDKPMFLAGYFTGTEMQVEDQVRYAARILGGDSPKSLPIGIHASGYYMDWAAMQKVFPHVPYSAYTSKFKIVNVPFYLANPGTFAICVIALILVISGLVYLLVYGMLRWKERGQALLMEELQYEEKVHDLMFSNAKDTLWEYSNGVFTFSQQFADYFSLPTNKLTEEQMDSVVHEDSRASYEFLKNFRQQRGKKTIRLHMTPDMGKHWYWGEITYTATDESAKTGKLYGLLLNIDQKKATEEQLEQAQLLASQVALKENFLANISHDLRTPLNAVTGFSALLTTPGMVFEEGEREQYGEIIHQNTDMILNMIDSVMQKAQIETGDIEIIQKPVSMYKLMNDCYNTNHIIAPTHLDFKLEMAEPDVTINIDMTRTKQVVNNFLSNAFKFTTEGSVTLGWRYMPDDPDKVEVYVKDTGIGVEPEKQAMLFERYQKVNETDKGTGLGLNISKTIMEKQGGTIGVESELGKGSKFFFRLSRYVQCLALIVSMCLGLMLPSSCVQHDAQEGRRAKVLLFHSYGRNFSSYREFNDCILETFREHDINADVRHVYLDLENPAENTRAKHWVIRDSLMGSGWTPDVILTEGDRAASDFIAWRESGHIKELDTIPVICGGMHHPEWDKIRKYNNIVVISDPIDYCANINLAVEMTGKNCVEVELDYFAQDSLIRKELRTAIARPPYIDNSDFHIDSITDERFSTDWKDSVMVLVYSTESPERNTNMIYDREEGDRNLWRIYIHSWLYPSVAVKRDIYSSSIADKTGRPQFTAVKAGFATGDGKYLCGYFASYTGVGSDMGRVAAEILKGADLSVFVGLVHEKHYYMDYDAMKLLDMKYDDYKERFIIVGAPTEVKMPVMVYATWIGIILVFLVALFAILMVVMEWRTRSAKDLMAGVKRRAEIRTMALHGADSHNVHSEQDVKDVLMCMHPDQSNEVPLISQALDIAGPHNYEINADIERNGNYRWWQLRFVVMFDNKRGKKNVEGIMINVDETKKYEEDLRKAMNFAEEARQKEDFLMTISHEIRTPLNAVVGFSDVICSMPADSFTPEEMEEYAKIIKANNTSLAAMIEDILMFSRIESGRIQYVKEEFEASALIREVANDWMDMVPEGIELQVIAERPDIMIVNDRTRLKYILNQMVSNSVKFTKQGSIVIGVAYHLNTDRAEFFIGDTGCGLPQEKQHLAFGLFWKDDGFVPGLGLGLHVAKKLADGMGFDIGVESKVDYGSKFSVISEAFLKPKEPAPGEEADASETTDSSSENPVGTEPSQA